jgi:hypothetical protein
MGTLREIGALLATLREVERSLSLAAPGTPEHERLMDDAGDLHAEYHHLVREDRESGVSVGSSRGPSSEA